MAFHHNIALAVFAIAPIVTGLYPAERVELARLERMRERLQRELDQLRVIGKRADNARQFERLEKELLDVCQWIADITAIAGRR